MKRSSGIAAHIEDSHETSGEFQVTFYTIRVTCLTSASSWEVERRYREFDALYTALVSAFPDVPLLPSKWLLRPRDQSFHRQRRIALDVFLREVTSRAELVHSAEMSDFLEIGQHFLEAMLLQPQLRSEFTTEIPLAKASLSDRCLIGVSKRDSSQDRSAIDKAAGLALIFRREEKGFKSACKVLCGATPTALCWDQQLTFLALGLSSGEISLYRLYSELSFSKYAEFCCLPAHAGAVRGLAINCLNSYLYSAGDDCRLLVSDASSGALLADVRLAEEPREVLFSGEERRLVVAMRRKVAIFSTETQEPVETLRAVPSRHCTIASVLWLNAILLAGTASGLVLQFPRTVEHSDRPAHEVGVWKWRGCVSSLCFSQSRREVVAGNDEGLVSLWSLQLDQLLCVFRADAERVSFVLWSEIDDQLVVYGLRGKSFRFFELPSSWNLTTSPHSPPVIKRLAEDDLAGWDR